jgi:hypothetical protein
MTGRRNNPADPTAERAADQSTQSASGISGDRNRPDAGRGRDTDLIPRQGEDRHETPRQFDRDLRDTRRR